jgi:hypothetical protein
VKKRCYNFALEPYFGEPNQISGVMIVATEVTEEVLFCQRIQENERALQLSEERLRLALTNSSQGL